MFVHFNVGIVERINLFPRRKKEKKENKTDKEFNQTR